MPLEGGRNQKSWQNMLHNLLPAPRILEFCPSLPVRILGLSWSMFLCQTLTWLCSCKINKRWSFETLLFPNVPFTPIKFISFSNFSSTISPLFSKMLLLENASGIHHLNDPIFYHNPFLYPICICLTSCIKEYVSELVPHFFWNLTLLCSRYN